MKNENSVFKKNAKLETKKIDFSDPKTRREVRQIREEQEKLIERKNVEVERLKVVIQL